jgi:arabinan endo-1,5-alpha-L-arabinosidase
MLANGTQQAQLKGDFENVAGVDITSETGVTFESLDPGVISITSTGLVTSVGSVDATGTIKASYSGKSATQSIHVVLPVAPKMIHRYSFTSDASDSVGTADGTLVGDATITDGAAVLSGTKPSYVDFPNDLVDGLTDVTLEVWLTWNGGAVWQRIWDFGNNTQGEDAQGVATQSIFLTPNNGGVMDLSIFPDGIGGQQVINGTPLTQDVAHHIVWTYSAIATTARLFVDGVENGSNTDMSYTLSALTPLNNIWLGHSQYIQDADLDATITEFRIYKGTFQDADVAADFAAGPDTLPGAGKPSLSVSVANGKLVVGWPAAASGFALETSTKLVAGASWSSAGSAVLNGSQNEVTITPTGATAFYRLKK